MELHGWRGCIFRNHLCGLRRRTLGHAAVSAPADHVYECDADSFADPRIRSGMNFYELTFAIWFLASQCFCARLLGISEGLLEFLPACHFDSLRSPLQTAVASGVWGKKNRSCSCIEKCVVMAKFRKCRGAWERPEWYHCAVFVRQGVEVRESKHGDWHCCPVSPFCVR